MVPQAAEGGRCGCCCIKFFKSNDFLSVARQLYCLGNDPDHSIGTRSDGDRYIKSGLVVWLPCLLVRRRSRSRSNDENSSSVLLRRPFADVSNLHCGFIRLFPKRRVTLVEGFSSDFFFLERFSLATDTSCRTLHRQLRSLKLSNLETSRAHPNRVMAHAPLQAGRSARYRDQDQVQRSRPSARTGNPTSTYICAMRCLSSSCRESSDLCLPFEFELELGTDSVRERERERERGSVFRRKRNNSV